MLVLGEACDSTQRTVTSVRRMAVAGADSSANSSLKGVLRNAVQAADDVDQMHVSGIYKIMLEPASFSESDAKQKLKAAAKQFASLLG